MCGLNHCFLFGFFNFGDSLLRYEVICKCAIKNGVLARCEVFFW